MNAYAKTWLRCPFISMPKAKRGKRLGATDRRTEDGSARKTDIVGMNGRIVYDTSTSRGRYLQRLASDY